MKMKYLFLACGMAALFAACQNENEPKAVSDKPEPAVITESSLKEKKRMHRLPGLPEQSSLWEEQRAEQVSMTE